MINTKDLTTIKDYENKLQEVANTYEDKINYLNYQIEKLRHQLYGQKSEKSIYINPGMMQKELFDSEEAPPEEDMPEKEVGPYKRKAPRKDRFPKNALRCINNIELPEDKRICPCCKLPKKYIGFESSEKAQLIPAKCIIRDDRRFKYCCDKCKKGGVTIAPPIKTVFPKSKITDESVAQIVTSKYSDHVPLYRQSKILARDGVRISDSSMVRYCQLAADVLSPIVYAMLCELVNSSYLQVDETTLPILKMKKNKTHTGYLWAYSNPLSSVVFIYDAGRGSRQPETVLNSFSGILQTDRYVGYSSLRKNSDIIDIACWSHSRRKFIEAEKYSKKRTGPFIKLIAGLYLVEAEARDKKMTPDKRKELRQKKSVPWLTKIKKLLDYEVRNALPSTPLGKAVSYTLSNWPAFVEYVNHGEVEIDNNLVENSIRPIALGRKNFLFAGSEGGAESAGVLFSITETCRRLKIDPRTYLTYVFKQLALNEDNIKEICQKLTPLQYLLDRLSN